MKPSQVAGRQLPMSKTSSGYGRAGQAEIRKIQKKASDEECQRQHNDGDASTPQQVPTPMLTGVGGLVLLVTPPGR